MDTQLETHAALGLAFLGILQAVTATNQAAQGAAGGSLGSLSGPSNNFLATPITGIGTVSLRPISVFDINFILPRALGGTQVNNLFINQNSFFGGPSSGGTGAATFRPIAPVDVPNLSTAIINSGIFSQTFGGLGVNASAIAQKLFYSGPATGAAAPSAFRAIVGSDILPTTIDASAILAALISVTNTSGNLTLALSCDISTTMKARLYAGSGGVIFSINSSTANNGATWTKDDATQGASYLQFLISGIIRSYTVLAATASPWSVPDRLVEWNPGFSKWMIKNTSTTQLRVRFGNTWPAVGLVDVLRIPVDFGVVFQTAPLVAGISFLPVDTVNISASPLTVSNLTQESMIVTVPQAAIGLVRWIGEALISN